MLGSSLERFGTDYIDIYWIHNPADVERWTPFLANLVKNGKVKRVGVSNHNLAQIKRAEEILSKEGVHISAGCAGFAAALADLLKLHGPHPDSPGCPHSFWWPVAV